MKKGILSIIGGIIFALTISPAAQAAESWTFGNSSLSGFTLDAYSPSTSGLGTVGPSLNPTLTIQIGKRYQVTDVNFTVHPLEILAKGTTAATDVVLLSMKAGVTGTLETTDASVNWQDTGTNTVAFTMTQSLYNAMTASGKIPGYRCGVHTTTMRGNFNVIQPLSNPIPAVIQKGTVEIELQTMAAGLISPVSMKPASDGTGRLFIIDQAGKISIIQNDVFKATPFLDVTSRLVTLGVFGSHDVNDYDERGLLDMAMHPGFSNPASPGFRKIYTFTSEPTGASADFLTEFDPTVIDCQSVIAEWTVSAIDANAVDTSSRREIMRINKPQSNHNGGMLVFGPDGYLYISLGDGGAGNDSGSGHGPNGNGQNLNAVLGKILRIDPLNPATHSTADPVSANGKYRVPATNPFVGIAGVDEIYAYGFRNPFRFSFDSVTGKLIVGDVGQDNVEEIDIVQAGKNYGWNLKEGTFRFDPQTGFVSNYLTGLPSTLVDPIAEYDHDEGIAVIGGYIYHGSAIPNLVGKYVFGDFTRNFAPPGGRLFYADVNTGQINEFVIGMDNRNLNLYLKGLGQDNSGEIYVLASQYLGPYGNGGKILKIVDLCTARTAGDLNNDCVVNYNDLSIMDLNWLGTGTADLDGDSKINFDDYAILAEHWLVSTVRIPGDLNSDGVVNYADLLQMHLNWLSTGPAELNDGPIVNLKDYAILASHWLTGAAP